MPFVSASAISPYNSIRGGASASASILDFAPFNVWDSEHLIVTGNTITFEDFNNVGSKYNLVNPAATNKPDLLASDSEFNGLPSLSFDGVAEYVVGIASNYRSSDTTGAFISVMRKTAGTSTRLNPFLTTQSSGNKYIGYSIIGAGGTFQFTVNPSSNKSFRGSTNINNNDAFSIANINTGTSYKQYVNDTAQTVTMTGANDGSLWINDAGGSINTLGVGALVRGGNPSNFAKIDWVFSGYFPYTSDAQIEGIMTFLINKYGL